MMHQYRYAILFIACLFLTGISNGQTLYSKSFGKSTDPAIIFLHGGPGFHSAMFELTTGQKLADKGFFVIVYDRRGEGRSSDNNVSFTYKETFADIDLLCDLYGIRRVNLIGHSFGGIIATRYAYANPGKVGSVILAGSPISMQESFRHIISSCKNIYQQKKDSINLSYISMLEKMDTASLEYSSYCLQHAMSNGFYNARNLSDQAKAMYTSFMKDSIMKKLSGKLNVKAPHGFWKNEQYTCIDMKDQLAMFRTTNIRIFGIYGKDDGLYSAKQISDLKGIIGQDQVKYIDNCSHNVFVDQQEIFLDAIKEWVKD